MILAARAAVAKAVRQGVLARLDGSVRCVDCGAPATGYDHRDYARPLDVQPVCRSCNNKRGHAANWERRVGLEVRLKFETAEDRALAARIQRLAIQAERSFLGQLKFMVRQASELDLHE